ncbi:MAG: heat shock protein HspQ [Gammaproteobacteria bacterium]|nr:heat shock protein HspQ [Gammaproteobacteria bacterium]
MDTAAFSIGQVVHHTMFEYRGVIYDVDAMFAGSEEWYEQVARSRPPRNKPWYRVLVDGQNMQTYVAEPHLEAEPDANPVDHPLIKRLFSRFEDGSYVMPYS